MEGELPVDRVGGSAALSAFRNAPQEVDHGWAGSRSSLRAPAIAKVSRFYPRCGLDAGHGDRRERRVLLVFGRVPMFYYILHLYLIHTMAILIAFVLHQPALHGSVIADFATKPVGYGHGLPFIYVMWILAVAILYLPCRWFMGFRSRHRDWAWLSYL
jgi:hypothetical protein